VSLRTAFDFLLGAVRDPATHDASSTRIAALICVALAAADVIVRLIRKEAPDAPALVALIGGGTVSLLTRVKGDGSEPRG
jgi:hypothetical protein